MVERCWLILDSTIEDDGVMKSHFFFLFGVNRVLSSMLLA